jgi:hypothetical protein
MGKHPVSKAETMLGKAAGQSDPAHATLGRVVRQADTTVVQEARERGQRLSIPVRFGRAVPLWVSAGSTAKGLAAAREVG